jgi:type IV pilus assembly protein PilC
MLRALEILESQTENARLRAVVAALSRDVREGATLSAAMRKHPPVFSSLYTGMIWAGESSGSLVEVMDRLIYVIQHEAKVKSDVRSALQYPMIVLGALAVAFFVLLTFVVPKFAAVFGRAGLALPLPTRICLALSGFIREHWIGMLAGAVVVILVAGMAMRTPGGRYARDRVLMSTPLIGPLIKKAAISRFASIFAILQATGVAVLDSMRILSDTIGNAVLENSLRRIQGLLRQGHGIAGPLKTVGYFTPMLVNMVAIGEESGNLHEMLREIARLYDSEVEYATKRLSDAIGPALVVSLAVVVGFFALAIYMPMWEMGRVALHTG